MGRRVLVRESGSNTGRKTVTDTSGMTVWMVEAISGSGWLSESSESVADTEKLGAKENENKGLNIVSDARCA